MPAAARPAGKDRAPGSLCRHTASLPPASLRPLPVGLGAPASSSPGRFRRPVQEGAEGQCCHSPAVPLSLPSRRTCGREARREGGGNLANTKATQRNAKGTGVSAPPGGISSQGQFPGARAPPPRGRSQCSPRCAHAGRLAWPRPSCDRPPSDQRDTHQVPCRCAGFKVNSPE